MLTKEQCIVGAIVRGVWVSGTHWEGRIRLVTPTHWQANLYKYPHDPLLPRTIGLDISPDYSLRFDSDAMLDVFSLVGYEKPPKPLRSWRINAPSK